MTLGERLINGVIRLGLRLSCRLDVSELSRVPAEGPAILISNHTTQVEGPLFYIFLRPRRTIALGKKELWKNPVTRMAVKAWGVIPVDRGGVDMGTIRACFGVLDRGDFLCLAPEGHRSPDGALRRALPGATFFAARRGVPIYPMAQWGLRDLGRNLRRFRRTPVHIRVGEPFTVESEGRLGPEDRQAMADEMMYRIARLLPEEFRGAYADLSRMTGRFLRPGNEG